MLTEPSPHAQQLMTITAANIIFQQAISCSTKVTTNLLYHISNRTASSISTLCSHLLVNQPCGKPKQMVAKISSRGMMKFVATLALFALLEVMKCILHHVFTYIPS
jgi:hypothetical protein